MTADKLFGAAAGYLMLGVLWTYFYVLVDYCVPVVVLDRRAARRRSITSTRCTSA